MDDSDTIAALKALKPICPEPNGARFRGLFPHVEAALATGVSRQTIVGKLTSSTFNSYREQCRKAQRLEASAAPRIAPAHLTPAQKVKASLPITRASLDPVKT